MLFHACQTILAGMVMSIMVVNFFSPCAEAAKTITRWNTGNVITQCSSNCIEESTYYSTVYDSIQPSSNSKTNGGIIWTESDVQTPGMKVVTDGEGELGSTSCIMTAGFDQENPSDPKQCNDGFQTSKRFKRYVNVDNGAIDLVFDVEETPAVDGVYRVFEKYINLLDYQRIAEFRVQLGVGVGSGFSNSPQTGLSFTTRDGTELDTATQPSLQDIELAGFFAFGLFGNASDHQFHETDGYFDPTTRATFTNIVGTKNEIRYQGISANYASLYGENVRSWLSKNMVPTGFVYDHDDNPDTEGKLMADWNGEDWQTYRLCSDPLFVNLPIELKTPGECRDDSDESPVLLSQDTVDKWKSDSRFLIGPIEDLSNVNLNYHLTVDDEFTGSLFTLRIVPTIDSTDLPSPWLEDETQDCENVFFLLPAEMMHQIIAGHCKEMCVPSLLAWIFRIFFGWDAGYC